MEIDLVEGGICVSHLLDERVERAACRSRSRRKVAAMYQEAAYALLELHMLPGHA